MLGQLHLVNSRTAAVAAAYARGLLHRGLQALPHSTRAHPLLLLDD
jgi:hypothetical protein